MPEFTINCPVCTPYRTALRKIDDDHSLALECGAKAPGLLVKALSDLVYCGNCQNTGKVLTDDAKTLLSAITPSIDAARRDVNTVLAILAKLESFAVTVNPEAARRFGIEERIPL